MPERTRVIIAEPGHDRGAEVIARALRDAGMEVVYTGQHQTPEQIVRAAVQEDADAVGLSSMSAGHLAVFRRVVELLTENDASDVVLFGGGIVPESDIPEVEEMGVGKIFTATATLDDIVDWVRVNAAPPGAA